MGKLHKVNLTAEEGQLLLLMSANFQLPEKLGETAYGTVERAQAREEVRMLFRDLKAVSPHLQRAGRKQRLLFGPLDGWEETQGDKDASAQFWMRDTGRECEVRLSDDAESGLLWCLVTYMNPASASPVSVMVAENVVWPFVAKLGKVEALRESLGLDKAQPRRWRNDPEREEVVATETVGNGHPFPIAK